MSYRIEIIKDRCKGCGLCILWCPFKHISFSSDSNKKGVKYAKANKDNLCNGCGICYMVCPDYCVTVCQINEKNNAKKAEKK